MFAHRNPLYLAFMMLVLAGALWYTAVAGYKLIQYARLSQRTEAVVTKWFVEEITDESFLIGADYTYEVEGKTYTGETIFNDWPYLSPWAAEQVIKNREKDQWFAWHSSWDIAHSSLQKSFPTKECVSAGMLWVLFVYFLWLGYYVSRYYT